MDPVEFGGHLPITTVMWYFNTHLFHLKQDKSLKPAFVFIDHPPDLVCKIAAIEPDSRMYLPGVTSDNLSDWVNRVQTQLNHVKLERLMEEEGVKCFVVMAADAPLGTRMGRAVRVLAPEGAESDKHLFPESCLQDGWTDDYAKSEAFEAEYRAVTDPDDGQKWPKGLTEEGGKLYRNGKLLVPESGVLELCEAWHHHMMHPGVKKQALDMQRRFEIDQICLYNAKKKVSRGCSVCQACNPDNRNVKGEAQWTPVPDQPMESVAINVFSMPEVHIGKETFDCGVFLCGRPQWLRAAVAARKRGLLAKEVAVMMIRHWLTVFDIPRTICSD